MKASKNRQLSMFLLLGAVACSGEPIDSTEQRLQTKTVTSDACSVTYEIASSWSGGFGAEVELTNLKSSAISGWTVEWDFASGQKITGLWNGSVSQSGGHVSVHDAGWNGNLGSNQTVSFGFNGTWSGENGIPTGFKLNGVSCEGGSVDDPPASSGGSSSGGASSGGASIGGSGAVGGGSSDCDAPEWQYGVNYDVGDIVAYQGQLYIAEHENPGYSPTISTWFWDPYDGDCDSSAGGSSSGGTSSGGTSSGGTSSGGTSSGGSDNQGDPCEASGLTWKTARKTHYTSYPDPGSDECVYYNGCTWAGYFAGCDGQQSEQWVAANNIAAIFPNFGTYEHHDLCIRSGDKTMVVTVYDTCADSDCSGCCTANKGGNDALIDLESYTNARWGLPDSVIEWADLGPSETAGCE